MAEKGTYRVPYLPMVQQVQHVEYGIAETSEKQFRNLTTVGERVAVL
jgi:putrescine aminotransferase